MITPMPLSLLQQLIATPSVSREEDKAADLLERYIEAEGYIASRLGNNVWTMGPGFDPARPTLLLNSHIDTVKPVTGWTRDPFTPVLEGDRLYGLGSNDAGASRQKKRCRAKGECAASSTNCRR